MYNSNITQFKSWFLDYARTFRTDDPTTQAAIDVKVDHTLRVCDETLYIGKALGLPGPDLRIAEITALFHDVGRFEQYARYHTFADSQSEDHAEIGVRILRETGVLDELPAPTRSLILRAVGYHNKLAVPEAEDAACRFFSNLLRDADKLDSLDVLTDYYLHPGRTYSNTVVLELPDTPGFSDAVYTNVMARQLVDVRNVRNLNDFKLVQVAWTYDVNFAPTLRSIVERGYLTALFDTLPRSSRLEAARRVLDDYISQRQGELCGTH